MGRVVPRLCWEGEAVVWRWPQGRWHSSLCFLMGQASDSCSGDTRMWQVTGEGCWG